eukprot:scaffold17319_cov169-Skeletonema_dohrnii-CCMP3373.AAC.1
MEDPRGMLLDDPPPTDTEAAPKDLHDAPSLEERSTTITKSFLGMKYQSTIRNETDKIVYAIVADISPDSPPQMRLIGPHDYHTFNLSNSYYYLTYYTKDISSGRNEFHGDNLKVKGNNDYVILPEYLEYHLDISQVDPRISELETKNQGGQNQGEGGGKGKEPAGVKPFINLIKNFAIFNKTDKVVYVIVSDRTIQTNHNNAISINVGGNAADGTHMRPIGPHKNHTFNLESSDYYLTYFTEEAGMNAFHEINVEMKGKNDYIIEPKCLEKALILQSTNIDLIVIDRRSICLPPVAQEVNQGKGGRKQGTSQNVGGTGSSSTAGAGQGQGDQNLGDQNLG